MFYFLFLLSMIGFLLSGYLFFVEQKVRKHPKYKPACDISEQVSCTKAVTSPYSETFGVSNSVVGIIYYGALVIWSFLGCSVLVIKYATFIALLISIYLAYILFAKVKSACPVCISLYVINFLLFALSHL